MGSVLIEERPVGGTVGHVPNCAKDRAHNRGYRDCNEHRPEKLTDPNADGVAHFFDQTVPVMRSAMSGPL